METPIGILVQTVQEYQSLLSNIKIPAHSTGHSQWDEIRKRLRTEAGWTEEGSKHIETLARNYGSFVLRNALALAITLNIEDGKLGL